jgi:hypothetical protein
MPVSQFSLLLGLRVIPPFNAPALTLQFEVASIKEALPWTAAEAASGNSHRGLKIGPGSVEIRWAPLRQLIQWAYQVEEDQLSGPAWLVHPRPFVPLVDIQARLPAGAKLVSDYEIENDGRLQAMKSGSDAVEYFSRSGAGGEN